MATYEYTDQNEMIPAKLGRTTFEVVDYEERISSGGNTMGIVSCRQLETGSSVREQLVFTPAAAWKIDVFLKACGFNFQKGQQVDVNEQLLKGRQFSAEAYEEPYTKKDGTEGKAVRIRGFQRINGQQPASSQPVQPQAEGW